MMLNSPTIQRTTEPYLELHGNSQRDKKKRHYIFKERLKIGIVWRIGNSSDD